MKFGDVHAAGNIDKISINPKDKNEILVTDFKTGKSNFLVSDFIIKVKPKKMSFRRSPRLRNL